MTLVVAEQHEAALARPVWEALAAAQSLGQPVKAIIVGASVDRAAAELASARVTEVLTVVHPALERYTADGFVAALAAACAAESPDLVVFPHTYQARDLAPRLAARLDRALLTDCVAVRPEREGLVWVRPMFQGKLYADVTAEGPAPHCVTLQIGAFRADAAAHGASPAPVRTLPVPLDADAIRQKPDVPFREARQSVDLTQARRIVAIGRGIKSEEHIALARELATALGAEIAASRPICDAGWLPMDRQIGSSGQTVAPQLYLALGISGAIQHVVGIKGARTIVAINKDPEAPIFELADYGIAGDLFDLIPALIGALTS